MNIREKVRGALRRIAGVSLGDAVAAEAMGLSAFNEKRRTAAALSILSTFGFPRSGTAWSWLYPKPTPANLRRFAETPVARKAINTIKDRIAGMKWRVQARRGRSLEELVDWKRTSACADRQSRATNLDVRSVRWRSRCWRT